MLRVVSCVLFDIALRVCSLWFGAWSVLVVAGCVLCWCVNMLRVGVVFVVRVLRHGCCVCFLRIEL